MAAGIYLLFRKILEIEMITPFEVYVVMQLDSIGGCFTFVAAAFFCSVIFRAVIHGMNRSSYDEKYEPEKYKAAGEFFKEVPKKLVFPLILLFSSSLIPSSKTAAAMIILPALTSKEVTEPLAAEGKELYALAKQALRDAVDSKDAEPKK